MRRALRAGILAALSMAALIAPGEALAAQCDRTSTGLVPLEDLGRGQYQGSRGGLYPDGRNERPPEHEAAGQRLGDAIVARDASGARDEFGRYALISIGMSNTTQEFQQFIPLAAGDAARDAALAIVDGAQGGVTASRWANPSDAAWQTLDSRLAAAGVSPQQVAVAWVKLADAGPTSGWPAYARQLQSEEAEVLRLLHDRFPRLELAYLSSRIYAGYASTALNPEPYAYESGFSVKWLIDDQLDGDPALNWAPGAGPVEVPWLSWGPYLWADGLTPRRGDGLTWACEELADDGTHPSQRGAAKVAGLLHDFFRADSTARLWFNATNTSERALTLRLKRHLVARGEVSTEGYIGCAQRTRVEVQRRRNGGWRDVGSDKTNSEGRYRLSLDANHGRFRAAVPRRSEGDEGDEICLAAQSKVRES